MILPSNPFIIAEIGSNFTTIQDCLDSVTAAKHSGADAVKFQMFTQEDLYGFTPQVSIDSPITGKRTIPRKPMHGGIFPLWLDPISEKCRAQDIEFMCTPFSIKSAQLIDPYVKYHKVASSDMEYKELFDLLHAYNKPIFFSVGGHTMEEIDRVLVLLGSTPSVIMYCVSSYPAKSTQLDNLQKMQFRFKNPVGFSDHTTDIYDTPKNAVRLGAVVIEKHFKLRDMDTPDSPHSLLPQEFKEMVLNIKDQHATKLMTDEQQDMVLKHNRRLIAISEILEGDILTLGLNYGAFRSLTPNDGGLSAWLADDINGKRSRLNLNQGDHITLESVLL